jgi:hypothetical protein
MLDGALGRGMPLVVDDGDGRADGSGYPLLPLASQNGRR